MTLRKRNKLVFGIGKNDADYAVSPIVNGRKSVCKIYRAWTHMLERCYSSSVHENFPSYVGCSVTSEWLAFSSFREWMITQPWQGNQLDKDILVAGNTIYMPDRCVFVSQALNKFIHDSGPQKGDLPLGVSWFKQFRRFRADCHNPFRKKLEYLGMFDCPDAAHAAWRSRKHELACQYAETQSDERISAALRARFA